MIDKLFAGKIDAHIVFSPTNRFYFTGFNSSYGCVLITKSEKLFFTDFRYAQRAKEALEPLGFLVFSVAGGGLYPAVIKELNDRKCFNIGFEDKHFSVYEFKGFKHTFADFKLVPASEIIESCRLIKRPDEIAKIVEAQRIAERSLKKVISLIRPGVTEIEIANELMFECLQNGAKKMSFDTIVAFGENSANPHHSPTSRKFEKNDIILIDFGVESQGYCSDMTRTFCLNEPRSELVTIHNIVLEAQNYALKHIKAGMTSNEADSLAREFIRANGYDKEFGHSLGHGVGIEIHEAPRVSERCEDILVPGMVITVEPGIYLDGIGGVRIEDMVVVREHGVENLTIFDKSLEL